MTSPGRLALLATLATLVVGACGGGGEDAESTTTLVSTTTTSLEVPALAPTTSPSTTTTLAPETVPPETVPPETVPPETTTTEGPDPTACLVGEWIIDEGQMNSFADAISASSGGEASFQIEGFTGLTFSADGRYQWSPEYTITLEIIGASGSGVAGGTLGGSYTVADGLIMTTLDQNELTLTVNVMGQTFDGSDIAGGLLTSFPISQSPYDCSGPTPVIDFSTGDTTPRVPITLSPA